MTEQEYLEIKFELENSEIPKPSQEKILKACEMQMNNGWIPCSKRLPEIDTYVLVCSGRTSAVGVMKHIGEGMFESRDGYNRTKYDKKIIVQWQPLPEDCEYPSDVIVGENNATRSD